jgi:dTDP-4-amino-4,6-dideoxygalactose transaminase
MNVAFIDIKTHNSLMKKDVIKAFANVFDRGDFILGEQVRLFEKEFAGFCGAKYGVGVNSGTDALFLGLLSLNIKPADEVICPVYTYIATALSISYLGAKPVFVDIDKNTFNLDVRDLEKKITKRTKAIISVHLYGNPAPMPEILKIAKKYKLKVIEDAAQSHGAQIKINNKKWQQVGTFGDVGCFSFYPTKNLSGCGDAGMVVCNNKNIFERLLMLRDQGRRGNNRYMHYIRGYNSRLDSIQAAILRLKLKNLNKWNAVRMKMAGIYSKQLKDSAAITVPRHDANCKHVFHLYPVLSKKRDMLQKKLRTFNIQSAVVYHKPLHLQPAYKDLGFKKGDFPVAEFVCKNILCLPMHPSLTENQVKHVIKSIKKILN